MEMKKIIARPDGGFQAPLRLSIQNERIHRGGPKRNFLMPIHRIKALRKDCGPIGKTPEGARK
ncbi:hypothetical protein [Novosphingobium aquimarinum]|uniref:hypothetical protein n=1 Tax=Novosphingobium aquimarinum TaxID=2682494 RepID=UPI0018DB263C|nr:hypothetical protein [Novosphingobium aquimarinum]